MFVMGWKHCYRNIGSGGWLWIAFGDPLASIVCNVVVLPSDRMTVLMADT
jgi:hypothetical protein